MYLFCAERPGRHHQQGGDVVVDGKNRGDLPLAVADVHGRGFQDLAVRSLHQIGQVVLGLGVVGLQLLHHHVGRAVPHLPPGDMAVDNIHNAVVRISAQVVNDHLAAAAKLGRNARRHLFQQFQFSGFYGISPLSCGKVYINALLHSYIISHFLYKSTLLQKIFLVFKNFV